MIFWFIYRSKSIVCSISLADWVSIKKNNRGSMRNNKLEIDQHFIKQLIGHPTFQSEMSKLIRKSPPALPTHNSTVPGIVEQICGMLTQSYRKSIDQQTLTVYQTCSQLTKDIDHLKQRLTTIEATTTQASFMEKQKHPDMSLFSQMSVVQEGDPMPRCVTSNPEDKPQRQMSFMSSLMLDQNGKDLREEIQQKLRSSQVLLTEDLSKIENGMTERIKLLELSVNRKIENIFKTLSTLIESINDLQLKSNHHTPTATQKNKLQDLYDSKMGGMAVVKDKKVDRSIKEKQRQKEPRRRSFLGLNL